ncbi:MAG: SDR family oxidoreductase [Atopobiaceae bacterium]|nr:SDR family oxidoreductase [Atopobiaceae bacterium]
MIDELLGYKGKKCVVTGASSGMGLAATKLLTELGAEVYTLDMRECPVEGIKKHVMVNLSDRSAIDQAFLEIPDHIDCYFGIAGLSGLKTDYATTFNCDYTANWYITEQYLKTRMSSGGAIMYVSSTAGLNWMKYRKEEEKVVSATSWNAVQEAIAHLGKSAPSTFAYVFAKRCISYYAARLSAELGKRGIRVNTVLPGSTDTGMKGEFQKMAGGEEALLKEAGAAGRLATSLEMAWPIVFVNSAGASFVSGLELNVDYADTQMKALGFKKDVEDIPATNPLVLAAAKRAMSRKA